MEKQLKQNVLSLLLYSPHRLNVDASPGQAVSARGVASGRAVGLLEAVEQAAVQAGLALLQATVLLEAGAPAAHAPGIHPVTEATFLGGLTGQVGPGMRFLVF